MKILLISPSYSKVKNTDYFPLGIAFLASFCSQKGHTVRAINLNNHYSFDHQKVLIEELEKNPPEIIGIGGLTSAFLELEKLCAFLRSKTAVPIVLGGGVFSSEPELMMYELRVDYGIEGEGEIILGNLLDALESGGSLPTGVWHWQNDKPYFTGKGPVIQNLDELPDPDLDLLGIKSFLEIKRNKTYSPHLFSPDAQQDRMIPISASRSCPFRCTFCYHAGLGTYRQLSIEKLISLIKEYQKRLDTNQFSIYDELFSSQRQRIVDFCTGLYQKGLTIKWVCQLRVDSIDLEVLEMMKDSGCSFVSYGVESGSDTVLKSMRKGITTRQIAEAIKITREAKVGFQANFLYGDPAETPDTVENSLNFQDKHGLYFVDWSAVIPYPGSQIYLQSVQRGVIKDKIKFIRQLCNQSRYLWHDKVNMTNMADDQFNNLYLKLRELNDQNHRRRLAKIVSSMVIAKQTSVMEVACPMCQHQVSFELTYPPPHGDNFNLKSLVGISGVNVLCPQCLRKMHIKSMDIAHIRPLYNDFQKEIDILKNKGKPVVCMPAMDRLHLTFSEDISLVGLSIRGVLDSRKNHLGRSFMGCQVEKLCPETIKKYKECKFLVLPWVEFQETLSLVKTAGIVSHQILCWNDMFTRLQ